MSSESETSRETSMTNNKIVTDKEVNATVSEISVREMITAKYKGPSENGKYHGRGEYRSGSGRYVGEFSNGTFQGQGTMHVKEGRFEGTWENGVMVDGIYIFDDELKYKRTGEKYWDYCSAHDYRFQKELAENIPKDGPLKYACNGYTDNSKNLNRKNSTINLSNKFDEKKEILNDKNEDNENDKNYVLPLDCYDFVEGYYDPKRNVLCAHITCSDIRVPTEKEVEWIIKHCRVGKA